MLMKKLSLVLTHDKDKRCVLTKVIK